MAQGFSTRRRFLKVAAGSVLVAGCNNKSRQGETTRVAEVVPASALGSGRKAPSERIAIGFIGIGNMGGGHLGTLLNNKEVQLIAMCDVRENVRNDTKKKVEDTYAEKMGKGTYKGCDTYLDFRDMLQRKDLDAVLIATPEHWHAIMVIEAAKAGKDIYCEKPLSHTIAEARAMSEAVRRYNRVLQTGSQQRSSANFRQACEVVQSGRVGKLHSVYVSVGGTSGWAFLPAQPVPKGLDWDRWQGPAVENPYHDERASGSYSGGWRMIRDYSGGMMCDWGAHHFDIAQWGLGMDESGPVEIAPPDNKENPVLTYTYANGVKVYHTHGEGAKKLKLPFSDRAVNGVLFVGDKGWVEVNRGYIKSSPEEILKEPLSPGEVHLYASKDHHGDWLNCIRNRTRPICDVEVGARTISVCHLGNIAYWTGRRIKWDPEKERITNDAEAARMLSKPMRGEWRI